MEKKWPDGYKNSKKTNRTIIGWLIALAALVIIALIWVIKLQEAVKAVDDEGTYEMSDMVVAVTMTNPVERLSDAGSFRYGFTYIPSEKHARRMIKKVKEVTGQDVVLVEYESPEELGKALVNGQIEAAVYNEESTQAMEEIQPDYLTRIRILYQYGQAEGKSQDAEVMQEPFNIFISGIDTDGALEKTSRSDVNIVATVNPQTKQILLTTTPRDYYVVIPEVSGEQKDKLTHAGIYGIEASIATLEQIYDIDIQYYVRLNFTSMLEVIDTIDGVAVYSDYEFDSGNVKGYHFYKGTNFMNGEQALAYVRERYAFPDGDTQRGRNQEAVMTAIIEKLLTPAALENAPELITKLYNKVETNFSTEQLMGIASAQQKTQSTWNTVSVNALGTGDRQACYSMGSRSLYVSQPNQDSLDEIKAKMQLVLNGEVIK